MVLLEERADKAAAQEEIVPAASPQKASGCSDAVNGSTGDAPEAFHVVRVERQMNDDDCKNVRIAELESKLLAQENSMEAAAAAQLRTNVLANEALTASAEEIAQLKAQLRQQWQHQEANLPARPQAAPQQIPVGRPSSAVATLRCMREEVEQRTSAAHGMMLLKQQHRRRPASAGTTRSCAQSNSPLLAMLKNEKLVVQKKPAVQNEKLVVQNEKLVVQKLAVLRQPAATPPTTARVVQKLAVLGQPAATPPTAAESCSEALGGRDLEPS